MIGPEIKIERSCHKCDYCMSKSYNVQGDSGHNVYCTHPSFKPDFERRYIGDTSWETPDWCPELGDLDEN